MSKMSDLYMQMQEKIWEAVEGGATADDVYAYVTQYISPTIVTFEVVEDFLKREVNPHIDSPPGSC